MSALRGLLFSDDCGDDAMVVGTDAAPYDELGLFIMTADQGVVLGPRAVEALRDRPTEWLDQGRPRLAAPECLDTEGDSLE